jgi:hypothetical protein
LAAVLLAATLTSCRSQSSGPPLPAQDAKANLSAQAKAMTEAVLAKDHARLADLSHPALIEKLGGKEKYVQTVERVSGEIEGQGFKIASVACQEPTDPVEAAGDRYAIVPTNTEMTGPGGVKMKLAGYLIAASADGGRNWKFIDGAGVKGDRAKLKQLLPNFPDSLALPKQEAPVVEGPKP